MDLVPRNVTMAEHSSYGAFTNDAPNHGYQSAVHNEYCTFLSLASFVVAHNT